MVPPKAQRTLGLVVFLAGVASLTVEIGASRLLAPFFGNSTIVWSNIIGLILIYLSIGYWVGGRIADRHPTHTALGRVLVAAAVAVALLPFVAKPFLTAALHAFNDLSAGAVVTSFAATLALFALPVTLLGMVSPFAIRLALGDLTKAGATAGRLYALSTAGAIVGTFVPALITIPLIGTQRTLLASATLIALAGVLLLSTRWVIIAVATAARIAIPVGTIKDQAGLLFETESPYQYVQVTAGPDGSRTLQLNEGLVAHSIWRADTVLTGGEWDMFTLMPPLVGHSVKNILIIGNAGGTTAREFGKYYPDAAIDGVEIDPAVTDAGRRFLGLGDNPRLVVHEADGRPFLATSTQMYDLIIVDAYKQPYIPFQLTTQEFFTDARRHLTTGGIIALNVETIPGDLELSETVESTLGSVFPQAWRWPAMNLNELVLGINAPGSTAPHVSGAPGDIDSLVTLFNEQVQPANRTREPMTDDRAPVEWLTDRSLIQYIASGGGLSEPPLPTYPYFVPPTPPAPTATP